METSYVLPIFVNILEAHFKGFGKYPVKDDMEIQLLREKFAKLSKIHKLVFYNAVMDLITINSEACLGNEEERLRSILEDTGVSPNFQLRDSSFNTLYTYCFSRSDKHEMAEILREFGGDFSMSSFDSEYEVDLLKPLKVIDKVGECAVCMENCDTVLYKCKHYLCKTCAENWKRECTKHLITCPLCREKY